MATEENNPPTSPKDVVAEEYADKTAYDAEVASITSSLASAAVNYEYTHGRRYHVHTNGVYIYPVDEKESERLDLTHKMIELAMDGKLHFAPVEKPKRVLDIGAGTGIWTIDFAEKHPDSEIIGNDLRKIHPAWTPPNVRFEADDVEETWPESEKFDYIHCRCMGSAIRDWPKLVRTVFEHLNPGGYAEFIDFDVEYLSPDNRLAEGSDVYRLNRRYIYETHKMGIESCPGKYLEDWMTGSNFEGVTATKRFLPVGTWPVDNHLKEVGAWNFMMVDGNLEGFLTYLYAHVIGWSKEEIDEECAKIRKQLRDPEVHCMYTLHICYGRKPETADELSDQQTHTE